MASKGRIRFQPPRISLSPELLWVLARAFGPIRGGIGVPVRSVEATRLAEQLDLVARIVSRSGLERLRSELGRDAAMRLAAGQLATQAAQLQLESALDATLASAAKLDIPVILLKHAALWAGGYLVPGARDCRDLDVLVPTARASHLQNALLARGFTASGFRAQPQHLSPLYSDRGEAIELHHAAFGLSLRGPLGRAHSATADAFLESGLACRRNLAAGSFWLPHRDVLVAHAMVHGYAQHGAAPRSYPLTRMLADLVDLGAGNRDYPGDACQTYAGSSLHRSESEAILRLAHALAAGVEFRCMPDDSPEMLILRHVVSGACDDDYARALKLKRIAQWRDLAAWRRAALHALAPTRADLIALYGAPSSLRSEISLRIAHPFKKVQEIAVGLIRRRFLDVRDSLGE